MGIEPTLFAWEARVLPLNDTRTIGIVGTLEIKIASKGCCWAKLYFLGSRTRSTLTP